MMPFDELKSKPTDWKGFHGGRTILQPKSELEYYTCTVSHDLPLIEIMHPYLSDDKVKKVLDLGCGDGAWIDFLARRYTKKEFIGIDFAKEAIELTTSRTSDLPNVKIFRADATKLVLDDASIDLSYSWGLIEHFSDHLEVLKHWHAKIKKGGCLILTVPNLKRIDYLILRFMVADVLSTGKIKTTFLNGRCVTSLYGYQELWMPGYLYKVIEEAGFKIAEKFSLQSFVTIAHFLSYIPKDLINEYYKMWAPIPPGEDRGISIGVVCEKIC